MCVCACIYIYIYIYICTHTILAYADELGEEITELDASIAQWTKESNEATGHNKQWLNLFPATYVYAVNKLTSNN